jgi:hypothetical protein
VEQLDEQLQLLHTTEQESFTLSEDGIGRRIYWLLTHNEHQPQPVC